MDVALRELWLQRLLEATQAIVSVARSQALAETASMADQVMEPFQQLNCLSVPQSTPRSKPDDKRSKTPLAQTQQLIGNSHMDVALRELWLQRLLEATQAIVSVARSQALAETASMADQVMEPFQQLNCLSVPQSTPRSKDYQCPSVIHVAYKNDALRISHSYMVHNHRIMDADPSVYPGNRRLDKCEEELLYSIMDSLPRTRDVIEFAQHEFDVVLTAVDVRDIKQRKRARVHSDGPAESIRTSPPENTEGDSSRAEGLSQDQVDYKTEARHVASDLCEPPPLMQLRKYTNRSPTSMASLSRKILVVTAILRGTFRIVW
ncbi:uncharacterized protein DEA37_0010592 [Paragonimus westermani]|uniref:Uncharacterized protein n=1 Tax=Paragonimus westermani TaxID=34504 RepID=A0A5J4N9Y3_9TREM|nr:uncharacterized protein DEA37_0010592 [Paragonimus westermani]